MPDTALHVADATEQAALVSDGKVSGEELASAALERIERLDPPVNSVIAPIEPVSRSSGPFAGVPLLVTDAGLEIEGTPHCVGLGPLRECGSVSKVTTPLARAFALAGFQLVGKTNTSELCAGVTTEPGAFGATRNPWALGRTAGGACGGAAAAVALGLTPVAHGSDGTGSLRYPASCCGVATLKPSRGHVLSVAPAGHPDLLGVWTEFVLARSVRDLAGVLDAIAGPPWRTTFAAALTEGCPTLRVGLLARDPFTQFPLSPICGEAVEETGELLEELGHTVEFAHPPALDSLFPALAAPLARIGKVSRAGQLRWVEERLGRPLVEADLSPPLVAEAEGAGAITGGELAESLCEIAAAVREVAAWWTQGFDLLVTPVLRQPPWRLGTLAGTRESGLFPVPFSLTGQPAMSLPLHFSEAGLPIGVQLVAAVGHDGLLLRVAAQLELARPWAQRWPASALAP